MVWVGRKKLAFIPLFRPNAHPPDVIPSHWSDQIMRRAIFDPDPRTGVDRSLRTYIHTASSDLTAATGAAPAVGDPAGYTWDVDASEHVVYRGSDGDIHELWLSLA